MQSKKVSAQDRPHQPEAACADAVLEAGEKSLEHLARGDTPEAALDDEAVDEDEVVSLPEEEHVPFAGCDHTFTPTYNQDIPKPLPAANDLRIGEVSSMAPVVLGHIPISASRPKTGKLRSLLEGRVLVDRSTLRVWSKDDKPPQRPVHASTPSQRPTPSLPRLPSFLDNTPNNTFLPALTAASAPTRAAAAKRQDKQGEGIRGDVDGEEDQVRKAGVEMRSERAHEDDIADGPGPVVDAETALFQNSLFDELGIEVYDHERQLAESHIHPNSKAFSAGE